VTAVAIIPGAERSDRGVRAQPERCAATLRAAPPVWSALRWIGPAISHYSKPDRRTAQLLKPTLSPSSEAFLRFAATWDNGIGSGLSGP
jgi:hypothetical protein